MIAEVKHKQLALVSLTIPRHQGFLRAAAADSRCDKQRRIRHTSTACQAHVYRRRHCMSNVYTDDWGCRCSGRNRPCSLLYTVDTHHTHKQIYTSHTPETSYHMA